MARLIYRYMARGGEQQAYEKTHLEETNHQTPVEKADRKTHLEDDEEEATMKAQEVDRLTVLEAADQKTQLHLSLVREIHTCVHIMQHKTRRSKNLPINLHCHQ